MKKRDVRGVIFMTFVMKILRILTMFFERTHEKFKKKLNNNNKKYKKLNKHEYEKHK